MKCDNLYNYYDYPIILLDSIMINVLLNNPVIVLQYANNYFVVVVGAFSYID